MLNEVFSPLRSSTAFSSPASQFLDLEPPKKFSDYLASFDDEVEDRSTAVSAFAPAPADLTPPQASAFTQFADLLSSLPAQSREALVRKALDAAGSDQIAAATALSSPSQGGGNFLPPTDADEGLALTANIEQAASAADVNSVSSSVDLPYDSGSDSDLSSVSFLKQLVSLH